MDSRTARKPEQQPPAGGISGGIEKRLPFFEPEPDPAPKCRFSEIPASASTDRRIMTEATARDFKVLQIFTGHIMTYRTGHWPDRPGGRGGSEDELCARIAAVWPFNKKRIADSLRRWRAWGMIARTGTKGNYHFYLARDFEPNAKGPESGLSTGTDPQFHAMGPQTGPKSQPMGPRTGPRKARRQADERPVDRPTMGPETGPPPPGEPAISSYPSASYSSSLSAKKKENIQEKEPPRPEAGSGRPEAGRPSRSGQEEFSEPKNRKAEIAALAAGLCEIHDEEEA